MIRRIMIGLVLAMLAGQALAAQAGGPSVVRTDHDSVLIGNRAAPLKLVEYISYTCPHCAAFTREAEAPLTHDLVAPGKVSVEIRSFIRNPVDLAVAMLIRCLPVERFRETHDAVLAQQTGWFLGNLSEDPARQQRWSEGPIPQRMHAVASDFHLYELFAAHGLARPAAERCLNDAALVQRLTDATKAAANQDYVRGTPAFMLNGLTLSGTTTWAQLRPQIEARLP